MYRFDPVLRGFETEKVYILRTRGIPSSSVDDTKKSPALSLSLSRIRIRVDRYRFNRDSDLGIIDLFSVPILGI